MTGPEVASEAWLRRTFDSEVRDDIFGGHTPSGEAPTLVLLGGQPAAGKTRAQESILAERPELVSITGDDLRRYHPEYERLVTDDPLGMPAATAPVSGGLIRLALDHALARRLPVLLEGTFRDPAIVTGTATRFADAGYRVEVVAVAVPAPVSRLGAEQRYLGARNPLSARWTPPEAHETALAGSPAVVAALEALPAVSRVQVHSRARLLYENIRDTRDAWQREPGAADALRAEQLRPLTADEAASWLVRYGAVFDAARTRPGYLSPVTAPAYQLLEHDAATIIPTIPAADTGMLQRDQERRRIALRTAVPEPRRGVIRRLRDAITREPSTPPPPKEPSRKPPTLGL